jgi:hypothetical protein
MFPFSFISGGGNSVDPDAAAFIAAAGITDATQQNAVNTLVLGLKSANIWTKLKAYYPNVGGSSTNHKFNLINALDTDAAFRTVFNGGWAHSAAGAISNGTNAYADTFINALNDYSLNTITWGSDRVQSSANVQIGTSDLSTYERSAANALTIFASATTASQAMSANGFNCMSRIDNSNVRVNNNGTKTTKALAFTSRPNAKFNYGGTQAGFFSSGTWRMVFLADLLTDSEQDEIQTLNAAFQAEIGR